MSETGLVCTLFTLTFLNIALKTIKHLFDEVEKDGNETEHWFFLHQRDLFKAALKATLPVPGPLSTSASFPALHHMALTSDFSLRPFHAYSHFYSTYPLKEAAVSHASAAATLWQKSCLFSHSRVCPKNIFLKTRAVLPIISSRTRCKHNSFNLNWWCQSSFLRWPDQIEGHKSDRRRRPISNGTLAGCMTCL